MPAGKHVLFLNGFPYACPEPVLANVRFLVATYNVAPKNDGASAPRLITTASAFHWLKSQTLLGTVPCGSDELPDPRDAIVLVQTSDASVLPPQQLATIPKPDQAL